MEQIRFVEDGSGNSGNSLSGLAMKDVETGRFGDEGRGNRIRVCYDPMFSPHPNEDDMHILSIIRFVKITTCQNMQVSLRKHASFWHGQGHPLPGLPQNPKTGFGGR